MLGLITMRRIHDGSILGFVGSAIMGFQLVLCLHMPYVAFEVLFQGRNLIHYI